MKKSTSVSSDNYSYSPYSPCSVCGRTVYNIYPFMLDCDDCLGWSASLCSVFSGFSRPPLYNMGVTAPTLAIGGAK